MTKVTYALIFRKYNIFNVTIVLWHLRKNNHIIDKNVFETTLNQLLNHKISKYIIQIIWMDKSEKKIHLYFG